MNKDTWLISNNNRVGKGGIGERGHIREKKRGKRGEKRILNYATYIDFLV
jgi:hypothetical protein